MALPDFQHAFCEMTLDPLFAARVRTEGAAALAGFSLTRREQQRLVTAAGQAGMSLNCTLARGNRFATIVEAYPLTCTLLKPRLRQLLDELWHAHRPDNYQLAGEDARFAALLEAKIRAGELDEPYAEEVLRFEQASWELIQTLRFASPAQPQAPSASVVVAFRHDPRVVLPELEADRLPPPGVAEGEYRVRLTLRGDTLEVEAEE